MFPQSSTIGINFEESVHLKINKMKKHNFYAGPSILSQYTIKNTADAVLDFAGTGLSLLEISTPSAKNSRPLWHEARALDQRLLDVARRI